MNATQTIRTTRQPGEPWEILAAAAYLHISDRHLRRLIDEGHVKSILFGRRRMISDNEMTRISNEGTGN
jgi:excisionase family DNA binding protein